MKISKLPVLGICGYSGSGKTTLIEELLGHLIDKGLKVAVVKHTSKNLQLDTPGKDSDRFFQAGAHVYLHTAHEHLSRSRPGKSSSLNTIMVALSREHDLVLVEGYKGEVLPKVWLLSEGERTPPADCQGIIDTLPRDWNRVQKVLDLLEGWLPARWSKTPVYGCILVGGKSSRMGRAKHLIRQDDGKTWLEHSIAKIGPVVDRLVVVGGGELPDSCAVERLMDPPGVAGPLAGLLSALRWAPWAGWLVSACDMPDVTFDAVEWLLDQRQPGRWAVVPTLTEGVFEPLLAYYDFRALSVLEDLAAQEQWQPSMVAQHPKSKVLSPPVELQGAWRNVNYAHEL